MDYKKILDKEILAFNEEVYACYPAEEVETPELSDVPIEQHRKQYNAMSARLAAEPPADIQFKDQSIPTTENREPLVSDNSQDSLPVFSASEAEITVRLYTPPNDNDSLADRYSSDISRLPSGTRTSPPGGLQ